MHLAFAMMLFALAGANVVTAGFNLAQALRHTAPTSGVLLATAAICGAAAAICLVVGVFQLSLAIRVE